MINVMAETTIEAPNMQLTRTQLWSAMRLPLRLRIFETARRLGEASVTELAEAVGLNRTALYFHLRHLERAGLLISRSGEPTPGRRGKRPRYYKTAVQEIVFPVDNDSKRESQKAADFLRNWFTDSRLDIMDIKTPGGLAAKRIGLSWENFTDDEIGRIRAIYTEVVEIVRRARNRSNSTRKAPSANFHVGFVYTPIADGTMPNPSMQFKNTAAPKAKTAKVEVKPSKTQKVNAKAAKVDEAAATK